MVDEIAPGYFKTGEQSEGAKAFLEKENQILKNFVNENQINQSNHFEYAI